MDELPDHLRCSRTDGRQWRCKRRVMDDMKLCEIHYLQGRHRQFREKVPESLKLQRKPKNAPSNHNGVKIKAQKVENLVKMMKRKRSDEVVNNCKKKKKKKKMKIKKSELNLELIRMVLKREVEKRNTTKKKKVLEEEESEDDDNHHHHNLTRDLPNGLMAISSSSSQSPRFLSGNAGSNSSSDGKIGADLVPVAVRRRCFRSKNIEPMPAGTLQVLPYDVRKLRRGKRKRCHWCHRSGSSAASSSLTKCSSCQKHFFCLGCINERYFDTQEEVKMACPVCRGTCTCKECSENQSKDAESKDYLGVRNKVEVILHFHYLICMLLPVLKQINQDQKVELEAEAKIRGEKLSEIHIKKTEFSCNEQQSCTKCKASILDLHRSCPHCSYKLCLSCCRDTFNGSILGGINTSLSKSSNKKKTCVFGNGQLSKKPPTTRKQNVRGLYLSSSASVPSLKAGNAANGIYCPPKEFGGCGHSLLDLRCVFPLTWIKELEVSAEEIVCSYEFPDTSDMSSCCSLCLGMDQKVDGIQQLQEAAAREHSNDNYLYYPPLLDTHGGNVEHFQKHWSKGHPVIVRNVLQTTSDLSWDPVFMFCTFLERSIARYENNKSSHEAVHCLDWCEVEIGIRQYFMGSLNGQTQTNMWNEILKLKGWLSSQLFQEQFPVHYAEIIRALPLQEYMNPMSGLLNLAARMPQDIPRPDLGPCVYISYGCTEQHVQANAVINLCYDSYDVVNILAHTSDAPISEEQVCKVRKLLKKHKAQMQRESSRNTSEQTIAKEFEEEPALHSEDTEETGLHNVTGEEMHLRKRVARESCVSTREAYTRNLKVSDMSQDGESESDSEATLSCSGTIDDAETTDDAETSKDKKCQVLLESCNGYKKKTLAESCGAQWDVFRRQDVPKLIQYLRRHSHEFTRKFDFPKRVDHPILDQSFFLDSTHKIRLKEEFKIEPWTFEQRIGEAVIIPAGCPYQIRSPKSCVHVVLDFVSPENVTECIQLTDEVRLLPEYHKAKVDKLEVKRMALYSISSAIKEIRQLTCAM